MKVFLWNARARNTHVEATLNHPFPAQVEALAPPKRACGPDGRPLCGDDAQALELLNAVATRVVLKGAALTGAGGGFPAPPDLFEFLKRYVLLCPVALFEPPQLLNAVWDLAVANLAFANHVDASPDGAKENVVFLASIAKRAAAGDAAHLGHLRSRGARAVRALAAALAGNTPSTLRPALADCLHSLCVPDAPLARAWLDAALVDDPTFDDRVLPRNDKARVRDALCALLPEKPKFKALAVDLAKLACGETSLDALLAYELPAAAQ